MLLFKYYENYLLFTYVNSVGFAFVIIFIYFCNQNRFVKYINVNYGNPDITDFKRGEFNGITVCRCHRCATFKHVAYIIGTQ